MALFAASMVQPSLQAGSDGIHGFLLSTGAQRWWSREGTKMKQASANISSMTLRIHHGSSGYNSKRKQKS